MEKFVKYSLEEFVDALASKAAVPGGGGASALAASLGIALGNMVGEFTVGKKKYADAEEELRVCMARAKDLSRKFLNCIERDAEAFEPLSRAYAIPKDDKNRDIVMENCLRDAAKVPMEILHWQCDDSIRCSSWCEYSSFVTSWRSSKCKDQYKVNEGQRICR